MNDEFTMLCCRGDKAGSVCKQLATHVLVYINKATLREITDKPKGYCYFHAVHLQAVTRAKHGILSRIYSVDQWRQRVLKYKEEKRRGDRR